MEWDEILLEHERKRNSLGQQQLLKAVLVLFPSLPAPLINYKGHPKLVHPDSGINMELDIYFPDILLAFEFHGVQHYNDTHRGKLEQQLRRDKEKIEACSHANITLIIVPYWWNKSAASLAATVLQHTPSVAHLFPPSIFASLSCSPSAPTSFIGSASPVLPIPQFPPSVLEEREKVARDPSAVFLKILSYHENLELRGK